MFGQAGIPFCLEQVLTHEGECTAWFAACFIKLPSWTRGHRPAAMLPFGAAADAAIVSRPAVPQIH